MKWTDDKPTVEGWYFWRRTSKSNDSMTWEVYFYESEVDVYWIDGTQAYPKTRGQWFGPIPEPVE